MKQIVYEINVKNSSTVGQTIDKLEVGYRIKSVESTGNGYKILCTSLHNTVEEAIVIQDKARAQREYDRIYNEEHHAL